MEKEIRWHITSVYNYDVQAELNAGLTAARAAQDAICDSRQAAFGDYLADVTADWDAFVEAETASLDANTAAATATLEEGKAGESSGLEAFKQAQQDRFAAWADAERANIAAHVAACQEAWDWILASYCLKHGVVDTGNSCSWGPGSGYGNAGYLKGVAIEEHADVLDYGQDLDIKHIQNEQGLIDGATEWTMDGVAEKVVEMQAQVDADQESRMGGVEGAKQALRDALSARLMESMDSLDATVEELAARLLERENAAIEGVQETSAAWQVAIDELRARILWDIKELVWKLGYTQGYEYGAHDGHDAELLAQITALKEEYEAAIVQTLQDMADRVEAEQAAGDAANDAAWSELQGEFDRLTAEMEDAITSALADCEAILLGSKGDQAASIAAATDELNAFIDERLAAWAVLAADEASNAMWQEDSYYRHNLLRLLGAKQDSIDAAVAAVKAAWAEAMGGEGAEGIAFRQAQRDAFRVFTEETRDALAAKIAEDAANMAAIVAERVESLNNRLDAE